FQWLSEYLQDASKTHVDFVRQIDQTRTLHHYTDLTGLKGIGSEHDLWLTNALYCNDEAEIKLGIQVAREQIKTLRDAPAAPKKKSLKKERSKKKENSDKKKEYLDHLDKALSEPPKEGVYICCFCENGDDLSQWRAYGADGNGVSIEINPQAF